MILGFAAALLLGAASADASPVVGYGVATLSDPAMGSRLAARFKAHGQPAFLIGDPSLGLQQGDIVRFPDRAVLIDADVWQTLQGEGALDALRHSQGRVAQLRAKARPEVWDERRKLVGGERESKGYALGADLLRVLEGLSGGKPPSGRLQLSLERGELVVLAPRAFLDALRSTPLPRATESVARPESARPFFVYAPPARVFAGRPFSWRAWVVDTAGGATSDIRVELLSKPPEGMTWNPATRILAGSWPEGSWPVLAVARGTGGRTDTLRTVVAARRNRHPVLAGTLPDAWVGEPWTFLPCPSDSDHPAESLSIRARRLPPGSERDPASGRIRWTPPDSMAGHVVQIRLVVSDPVGDSTEFVRELRVGHRNQRISTDGLAIRLPWDTLIAGRTYDWSTAASEEAWRLQGATLDSVTGSDRTRWAGSLLRVRPALAGAHSLDFHFSVNGAPVLQQVSLPVRAARAPVWRSRSGGQGARIGDTLRYTPVAVSPEGDSTRIEPLTLPRDAAWDGTTLVLAPRSAGWTSVAFRATDTSGLSTDQTIGWKIEPTRRISWRLRHEAHRDASPTEALLERGSGRVGLLVPDLHRTFGWSDWAEQDWPMVFAGANLSGSERNPLWLDLGLVLRRPNNRLLTGGFLARLEGRYQPRPTGGRVEFEALGWAHQAVLAVDTAGMRLTISPEDSLGSVLDIRDEWEGTIRSILEDAYARDNVVLLTRLESWWPLHRSLEVGAGLWREDVPIANDFLQWAGAGARADWSLGPVGLRPAIRGGWGPAEAGWIVWWTLEIGSASPRP